MSKLQYGSFEVQSATMQNVLRSLAENSDKRFFVIVGEPGSGKTTMLNHINKVIFNNQLANLFDDETQIPAGLDAAIVTTGKEGAYDAIKKFDRNKLHIVEMPSLSERKADVVPFGNFFIEVLALMNSKKPLKLTEKAAEKLLQYAWPGNFHELEAVLESAFETALSADSRNTVEPEHIALNMPAKGLEFTVGQKLDEVERKYILQTLYFVHQNRTRAAEILGISIRTLRNKINQYREEGYL